MGSIILDLKGVKIKNITHADTFIKIYLETNPSEHICPTSLD